MSRSDVLAPDLSVARRFLEALEPDPEAVFHFRVLPEKNAGSSVRPRNLTGTFAACADELVRINQAKGGIFVVVNAGTAGNAAGIYRIRAYFVDKDGSPLAEFLDAQCPPDIIIETSPGRFHGYWLTHNAPLEEFTRRQRLLAMRFNGDTNICDLPRIMRLPGFLHQKNGDVFLSRIVKLGDEIFL